MSYLKIKERPEVIRVLRDAEMKISGLIGGNVILSIDSWKIGDNAKGVLKDSVCEKFNCTWHEMVEDRTRKRNGIDALHVYMYLSVEMLGCSIDEVATQCQRHRKVVYQALTKIKGFYDVHDPICLKIDDIIKAFKERI